MKDFLIEEASGNYDIQLVNFNFTFTGTVAKYVQQKLKIRLAIFRGEWYLNNQVGLPYFEDIFVKDPNLVFIEDLYKSQISSVDGVKEITSFELLADSQTRDFFVNFTVRVSTGEEVSLTI